MPTLTATKARSKLYRLIDEAASSHEPIVIKGKRGSAVLISEDDRHKRINSDPKRKDRCQSLTGCCLKAFSE